MNVEGQSESRPTDAASSSLARTRSHRLQRSAAAIGSAFAGTPSGMMDVALAMPLPLAADDKAAAVRRSLRTKQHADAGIRKPVVGRHRARRRSGMWPPPTRKGRDAWWMPHTIIWQ